MKPRTDNFDLGRRQVMAIINLTPDSFYGESRAGGDEHLTTLLRRAVQQGATMLDLGAYSTRPGAEPLGVDEEWRRLERGLRFARQVVESEACSDCVAAPIISIDTFRAEIVRRAYDAVGRLVVNDITAGNGDADMAATVAALDLPYIAMHARGTVATHHEPSAYRAVADEVAAELAACVDRLLTAGIRPERLALDPGFGFSKTAEQNFALLHGLDRVVAFGYPVVVGLSRKSMIYKTLNCSPDEALNGTTALHWECLRRGATVLRVHDVREAREAIELYNRFEACAPTEANR